MIVPIVCIGAGGHARMVHAIANATNKFKIVAFIEKPGGDNDKELNGIELLRGYAELPRLKEMGVNHFIVGVGGITNLKLREHLYNEAISHNLEPVTIVHPTANLMEGIKIGTGSIVFPNSSINIGAQIGKNVVINTNVVVEHDSRVLDHVHLAPSSCVLGQVTVGERAFIGANSTIKQGVTVGSDVIVGMSSVVLKDIPDGVKVIGNPANKIES